MSRSDRSPHSKGPSRDSEISRRGTTPPQLPSEPLGAHHDVSTFDCGKSDLNTWLRLWALNSDAAGNTRTWVWAPDGTSVIAYYSVAPHLVDKSNLPKKVARGAMDEIPSILLARLALSATMHGRGLGSALLADALTRISYAIEVAGGRLIVVDAIDDGAARFYENAGFVRTDPYEGRLVIKASDVDQSSR
jgi:GNAT superfamily N-acetyltransferase